MIKWSIEERRKLVKKKKVVYHNRTLVKKTGTFVEWAGYMGTLQGGPSKAFASVQSSEGSSIQPIISKN